MREMNISEIKPYEKNAKKHPQKQIEQIAESIKRFGFNVPIVLDKDNVIIAGHGRFEAAKQLGFNEVKLGIGRAKIGDRYIPAVLAEELNAEEIKAYRLADNKLNESEWDMDLAIEELKGLDDDLIDLTGFDRDLLIGDIKEIGWNPEKTDEAELGDGIFEKVGYGLQSFWKRNVVCK